MTLGIFPDRSALGYTRSRTGGSRMRRRIVFILVSLPRVLRTLPLFCLGDTVLLVGLLVLDDAVSVTRVGDAISAGFPWSRRRQQHCRCRLQANLYFEVRQLSFKRATCWTADSCLQSQWSKLIACYSLWCPERNDAFRSKWLLFIACA